MNLSEIVDQIITLRERGATDGQMAEYLASTLRDAGAEVQIHAFAFSTHAHAAVGIVVLLLAAVFVAGAVKRRHRVACVAALAIPLILLFEMRLGLHAISWPITKTAKNVIVQFPVQNPARTVVVGTHYVQAQLPPGEFMQAISDFLLPMAVIMAVMGVWQLMNCFGKLEPEDARTVMTVMGAVCAAFFGLWFASGFMKGVARAPRYNSGSIAALVGLARDMTKRYPSLQNTAVTVAFFGEVGANASGARAFAKMLERHEETGITPVYFIGLKELGRGGPHAFVIPYDESPGLSYADRDLMRVLNRAAFSITGARLESVSSTIADSKGFVEYGFPSVTIATAPSTQTTDEIDRAQLLLSLQLLERALMEFERTTVM
ncbi:MAG: hypothetical protein Kow0099_39250 [Candidatus Abyssubacteria bacterium]